MAICRLQGGGELVNVTEMKEGEIAQIKSWFFPSYVSVFVQRCHNYLFVLGSEKEHWDDISWGKNTQVWADCMVSVLGETEVLELRNEKSSK